MQSRQVPESCFGALPALPSVPSREDAVAYVPQVGLLADGRSTAAFPSHAWDSDLMAATFRADHSGGSAADSHRLPCSTAPMTTGETDRPTLIYPQGTCSKVICSYVVTLLSSKKSSSL